MELKRWQGKLELNHVESHTDRKVDSQGRKRIVTDIERMNQRADEIADWAHGEQLKE